jgi:hypothetical protein
MMIVTYEGLELLEALRHQAGSKQAIGKWPRPDLGSFQAEMWTIPDLLFNELITALLPVLWVRLFSDPCRPQAGLRVNRVTPRSS